MYEARTQEEILSELISLSELPSATIEGSFQYDIFASNAIEFAKVEVELSEMYESAFGRSSWDEYLDLVAESHGVIRRSAVSAIGEVTVTGNGFVSQGSIFTTNEGVRFETISDTNVINSALIGVQAVEAGSNGNVGANTIVNIPLSIAGIRTVTNDQPTHDGYDQEDDDTFKERYLQHVRLPRTSGNPYQYADWALEVAGVGAARVIRAWNGPNSVKVVIVNSNYEVASDYLIEKVRQNIEEQRAIGAFLTVTSAKPKVINIVSEIVGSIDQAAFLEGLQTYFTKLTQSMMKRQAKANYYVSIAQISSIIIVEGNADDHNLLTLNGLTSNIELDDEEMPVIGEVIFN